MDIQIRQTDFEGIQTLQELHRQEANCQIIHDTSVYRGFADPYLIFLNGRLVGYTAVGKKYPKDQISEFYILPQARPHACSLFYEVLIVTQAKTMEAQTNIPLMLMLLYDCAINIHSDAILFEDAFTTQLSLPKAIFRRATEEDKPDIFPHNFEPIGHWLLETEAGIVATGGFYSHYNPPYGDIFMEVKESERRQGYGSFLVQELKRVCYEAGKKPAARTSDDNKLSRLTLQKAGFLPCGRLLIGEVDPKLLG